MIEPTTPTKTAFTSPVVSGADSPSAKAIKIPEILECIFFGASNGALNACARASKEWSKPALDVLWREMDNIIPLLLLLSPLTQVWLSNQSVYAYDFENNMADVDPDRFRQYASRVRQLKYNDETKYPNLDSSMIAPTLITNILSYISNGSAILPNLRTLEWRATNDISVLNILPFVSPDLKKIRFHPRSTLAETEVTRLFRCLAGRTPNLKEFTFVYKCAAPILSPTLSKYISTCEKLTSITLPQWYHTDDIVAAAGKLPELQTLGTEFRRDGSSEFRGTCFRMDKGTFPKLTNLDFEASIHVATTLLLPPTRFSQLTGLCLSCRSFTEPAQLRALLSNIAASCEKLTILCLNLFADADPATARIPPAILRPLLDCKEMTRFELGHDYPLALAEKDIKEMAKAWPKIEALRLSEDARTEKANAKGEGVSLEFLRIVAREMPKLRRIGIYVDEGQVPNPTVTIPPEEQFQNLKSVYVGSSWVPNDDIANAGFFIANLCAKAPKIESFRSSWDWKDPPSDEATRKAKWDEVGKVVDMAFKSKEVSKRAIEQLEKQVQEMKETLEKMQAISIAVPATPVTVVGAEPELKLEDIKIDPIATEDPAPAVIPETIPGTTPEATSEATPVEAQVAPVVEAVQS